ncbi:MAG TPA: hypothetical protein VFN77_08995 [Acetobacteraceae bacterium]|nr:hypothetical protein [Acetobacteraceae bacterium]
MAEDKLAALREILAGMGRVAVAVSGGVDSLTLATAAHRALGAAAVMHHAVSPAVPPAATARTRALAGAEGWRLDVFEAGEFADPDYRANPVNRCFFCKTNLYAAIAARTDAQILSGTNLDDLGEYRPGLQAAVAHSVRHPFVEAGIDKAMVRRLAARLGLGALAELPAAPCLSSRVETGIAIEPAVLSMIDRAENLLRARLRPRTVRLRVRASGLVVELDAEALDRLEPARMLLEDEIALLATATGLHRPVSFAAYRTGSAFVGAPA